MPKSLSCRIKSLLYEGKITKEECDELLIKLNNHDKIIYNNAINDVIKKLKGEENVQED